ncbi:hypothetical protein AB0F25_09175 [Streptomyces wedmorensis]
MGDVTRFPTEHHFAGHTGRTSATASTPTATER